MTEARGRSQPAAGGAIAATILLLYATGACTSQGPPAPAFRNVGTGTAYTGDEACFSCHEEQYQGFQDHGMARSFYHDSTIRRDRRPVDTLLVHPRTRLYYRVFTDGDILYQEEILPGGSPGNADNLRRRADFVMGSGNAARTFLAETNGRLFELPLTWYTQSQKWDFSPGYRNRNPRFGRQIPDRCMACHNSYPVSAGRVDGKYTSIPAGIGCERCHGPGEIHVNERLDVPEPAGEYDDSIVNPARLDVDRRLDVCQQCHLQTTVSVLRRGRDAFDFVPSERLSDHIALFFAPETRNADTHTVSVISHSDRMKQSACFTATAGGPAPMECTTCHDPHAGFRRQGPEYFNGTCLECHSLQTLTDRVSSESAAAHSSETNCFSCHMPRVEAEDAPHSSFTDHWIRVVSDKSADPPGASDEPLRPYFEQDRGNREGQTYLGMALLIQGRQAGDPQLMAAGVTTIEAGLRGDANWAGASFLQGAAYLDLGRADLAIAPLESAVRIREDARYIEALARAYGADGRPDNDVKSLYERALQASPARYETRYRYARHLHQTGRVPDAVAQYQAVLDEYPWHPEAHLMLGTALLSTDLEAAERSLLRAALLDPDLRAALMRAVVVSFDSGNVEIRDFVRSESVGVRSFPGLQAVPVGPESAEPSLRFISDTPVNHLRVFSADGYPLRELVTSGNPTPLWNLRDSRGLAVPTGIYLVRMSPGAGPVIRILVINAP